MSECQFLGLERKKKRCITEAETEKREASCPPWSFYSCWPWLWCLIMMWLWLNGPWDCNVVREWKGNCLFSTIFILSSFTLPPNMTVCGFSPSVPRMNVVVKALLELRGWHCFTDSTFKTVYCILSWTKCFVQMNVSSISSQKLCSCVCKWVELIWSLKWTSQIKISSWAAAECVRLWELNKIYIQHERQAAAQFVSRTTFKTIKEKAFSSFVKTFSHNEQNRTEKSARQL